MMRYTTPFILACLLFFLQECTTEKPSPRITDVFNSGWNGLCLAVVRSGHESGHVTLRAVSEGLAPDEIQIQTR